MAARTEEQKAARREYERKRRADPEVRAKLRAAGKRWYDKTRDEKPEFFAAAQAKYREKYATDHEYRAEIQRRQREQNCATRYGMTLGVRDALLSAQGGRCALPHCGREVSFEKSPNWQKGAHVDHCHATGRVRGILCGGCNTALGRLGDTPESISKVLAYVQGVQS